MFRRAAGVLLHPTSLPGGPGCGDLGPGARRFLDWLADAGCRAWQVLPLGPTGRSGSPYSALSAFAGNPLLISAEPLRQDALLSSGSTPGGRLGSRGRADLARAREHRLRVLGRAFSRFERAPPAGLVHDFERFVDAPAQRAWLEDWVLFAALRRKHRGQIWTSWDAGLKRRVGKRLRAG